MYRGRKHELSWVSTGVLPDLHDLLAVSLLLYVVHGWRFECVQRLRSRLLPEWDDVRDDLPDEQVSEYRDPDLPDLPRDLLDLFRPACQQLHFLHFSDNLPAEWAVPELPGRVRCLQQRLAVHVLQHWLLLQYPNRALRHGLSEWVLR